MAIKFSIVLPTYNREKFVVKAIESVIKQDYTLWELIVIDDGSTDRTFERVNAFIEKDKRIKYYYQKNQERSVARNNGISKSKGEWICFLDSDDTYYHNHLFEFSNLIKQSKFKKGLYFCGLSFDYYREKPFNYNLNHKNNIEFLLLNTIGTPRACAHKEVFLENKFKKELKIGEDTDLWIRICKKFPIFFHRINTFIEFNHNNRTILNNKSLKDIRLKKNIIKLNKDSIRNEIAKKYISNAYYFKAKVSLFQKNKLGFLFFTIFSIISYLTIKNLKEKCIIILYVLFNKRRYEDL